TPVESVATAVLSGRPVVVTTGGDNDPTARVWDLATGEQIGAPLEGHGEGLLSVATTTVDGRPVAVTCSWDRSVRVWDLVTHMQIGEPLMDCPTDANEVVTGFVDGRPVAVVSSFTDHTVQVWDLATREQIGDPLVFPEPVTNIKMTSDGQLVVSFGYEIAVLAPR
ncbi:WD40 repeat domain-containing protein, partial [Priestia megaterium]|uniref:WD40 repeat domain-containing protein n=1 Tax=Priestia megaterium TaxID=1404 RepID=UPI0036DDB69A